MSDLRKELDELATKIAQEATQDAISPQERVDALKALTSYYAATQKVDAKTGGDDSDEDAPTFDNFATQIADNGGVNGREKVRSRRRDS